jgi:acyl carrier protein
MTTKQMFTPEQMKAEIFTVLSQIAPEADFATVDPNADLRNELDLDSFDFLNFLIGLNERLDVEIPEADYIRLTTLNDLVGYLTARAH